MSKIAQNKNVHRTDNRKETRGQECGENNVRELREIDDNLKFI